jgi:prepilin-type N-terminal cleavage/methylation domain-containing protein
MKGFTLIEMLVSIAIFSIVMVMALGALLALSTADRKAETLKSGIDNLTFALDSMSRAIRTGQNFDCGNQASTAPTNCPAGANYFTFLASDGVQTYYQLDTAQDGTSLCGQTILPFGCIERKLTSGGTWIPITSPDLVLQNIGFLFYVVGAPPASTGDYIQPKVTITAAASVPVSTTQTTKVFMQTSVTQRIYDQ